jgi:DNA repair protein RadD
MSSSELRPYQLTAIEALRANIRAGVRRQVLQLATGGGKTKVASTLTENAVSRNKRVLFLADRIELIDQASARFDAEGINHGIIQGQHWRFKPELPVQIATIQTLVNRASVPWDLIIVDECHAGGKRLNEWVAAQDSVVVGLSATPWAKGMGKVYQKLVIGATTRELIELGFLVDVEAWGPSEPDLSGVKVVAGEWEEGGLAKAMDTPKLVGDIVTTWLTKGENRQTIVFAVNVAHSQHIVEEFKKAGVNAAHVDGYENAIPRKKTVDAFRAGEIKLICNVGILDKGFDVPEASCLVMARPIRSSLMLHIQQIGRVLRPFPGKDHSIILDHAGNLMRHGFPTDPLPEELDEGKKKDKKQEERERKEREPKKCPKCAAIMEKGKTACPKCGYVMPVINDIYHEEGELQKILNTEDKRSLFAMIKHIQQQRGKSDGWAAWKFKHLAGVWPNHYRDVEPKPAEQWVIDKVKHLDIKWAKGQGRQQRVPGYMSKADLVREATNA